MKQKILGLVPAALLSSLLCPAAVQAALPVGGCENLIVVVQSSVNASIQASCSPGAVKSSQNPNPTPGALGVVTLSQSGAYGPDCTLTVTQGSNSAVLKVQQNYCALESGDITASVLQGPATLLYTVEGSYQYGYPGLAFFLFNPGAEVKP